MVGILNGDNGVWTSYVSIGYGFVKVYAFVNNVAKPGTVKLLIYTSTHY
jgi:hypothetical protein